MGFMTLFHGQLFFVFSQTTRKRHYLKPTKFYIHAADILL